MNDKNSYTHPYYTHNYIYIIIATTYTHIIKTCIGNSQWKTCKQQLPVSATNIVPSCALAIPRG